MCDFGERGAADAPDWSHGGAWAIPQSAKPGCPVSDTSDSPLDSWPPPPPPGWRLAAGSPSLGSANPPGSGSATVLRYRYQNQGAKWPE